MFGRWPRAGHLFGQKTGSTPNPRGPGRPAIQARFPGILPNGDLLAATASVLAAGRQVCPLFFDRARHSGPPVTASLPHNFVAGLPMFSELFGLRRAYGLLDLREGVWCDQGLRSGTRCPATLRLSEGLEHHAYKPSASQCPEANSPRLLEVGDHCRRCPLGSRDCAGVGLGGYGAEQSD